MITSFAYVGFVSPAVDEWRTFAPEVLGGQLVDGPGGSVGVRIDVHAPRIMIHPGDVDDVAYVGWDCGDAAGVAAVAAKVSAAGLAVADEPDTAALRHVAALQSFTDPWGFRHELTWGLLRQGPVLHGRPLDGFVAGELGLGHLVFLLPDLAEGLAFYTDILGFRVSDHIETGAVSLRFLHCNARHHTLALGAVPGMVGIHHLMLEVKNIDDVGAALDVVNAKGLPVVMSLGKHTNDHMTSFYVRTPSGFEIEYGAGGRLVDDDQWQFEVYDSMSIWGHEPPADPLLPGIIRPFTPAGV